MITFRFARVLVLLLLLFVSLVTTADELDETYALATRKRLDGRLSEAIPLYRRIASSGRKPLAEHALYHIGELSLQLKDLDQAAASFEEYLRRYPNGVRADDVLILLGESYYSNGSYDQAIRIYSKLLQMGRETATSKLRLGRSYEELGDLKKAIRYYLDLIEGYPNSIHAQSAVFRLDEAEKDGLFSPSRRQLLAQGIVLYQTGKSEEARAKLSRVSLKQKDAESTRAIYHIGLCYQKERKYKTAIAWFNKVLTGYPSEGYITSSEFRIAECYKSMGERKTAERRLLEFPRRYPWSVWADNAIYVAATIQMEDGRYREASQTFWNLYENYPKSKLADDALWFSGWCHYKAGRYDMALRSYREILKVYQSSSRVEPARFWMAKIYERQGNKASAAYHYGALVKRNAWYYGARAKERLRAMKLRVPKRQWDKGESFEKGLRQFPNARKFFSLGAYDDSAEELLDFMGKSEQRRAQIYYNLSLCYRRLELYRRSITFARYLSNLVGETPEIMRYVYPIGYEETIRRFSREYEVDPLFVAAMIYEESRFDSSAVSWAGAIGVMQIMPSTGRDIARRLNIKGYSNSNLADPHINIRFGIYYMSQLSKTFNGNIFLISAAYNAGPGRVQRWVDRFGIDDIDEFVEDITFLETRNHVKKVIHTCEIYRELYR